MIIIGHTDLLVYLHEYNELYEVIFCSTEIFV